MGFIRRVGNPVATTGLTATVSLPAHQRNDVLLLLVSTWSDDDASTGGSATPTGWTKVVDQAGAAADRRVQLFTILVESDTAVADPQLVRSGAEDIGPTAVMLGFAATATDIIPPSSYLTGTVVASTSSGQSNLSVPDGDHFIVGFLAKYSDFDPGISTSLAFEAEHETPLGPVTALTLWSGTKTGVTSVVFNYGTVPAAGMILMTVGFPPAPEPIPVIPADIKPMRLGCAGSYDVFITQNDPVTFQPEIVDAVGWSKLQWGRVLDDISEASVTLPDSLGGAYCCTSLGGLRPWRFGLRIERDAQLVWMGPITGVSRPVGPGGVAVDELEIKAHDQLARYRKRFASLTSQQYKNVDAGYLFNDIAANRALRDPNGFVFPIPTVVSFSAITREVVARDFELAWDILKELLDSSLDGFVMCGQLFLFQPGYGWVYNDGNDPANRLAGPYDPFSAELAYGLFTNSAWADRPGWDMNGFNQANAAYVPGTDSGELGFRRVFAADNFDEAVLDGVLEMVDPNPLHKQGDDDPIIADEVFQLRAESLVRLRALGPAVIEGGVLSQDAPIAMEHLRPGSLWLLDVHDACWAQLIQVARLKAVDVSVSKDSSGLTEAVSVTLHPPGYTEADIG